jgi:Na+:H+ antiporter, NhaA family
MSIRIEAPVGAHDHIRGKLDAPVTLVEYGDFECNYCALAFPVMEQLRAEFPDHLRFVFRHAPQTRQHPNAVLAAEASEAAGAQDRFWQYHDGLYRRRDAITWDRLLEDARRLELDLARFTADVEQHRFLDSVNAIEGTGAHTVRGTPTFFLNDVRYEDGSDFESLAKAIDAARSATR